MWIWFPGSGRSPGEGNGSPLQYSCRENPMDRGGWRTIVHRVGKSQTRVKWLSIYTLSSRSRVSFCYPCLEEFSLQSFQNYRTWKFILNQYCCSSTVTAESYFVFIFGHFLWQLNTIVPVCLHACVCSVAQLCLTLCNPVDCSPPGSSVHGTLRARIMEWVAISFSRGSSRPRDGTCISCVTYVGRQ